MLNATPLTDEAVQALLSCEKLWFGRTLELHYHFNFKEFTWIDRELFKNHNRKIKVTTTTHYTFSYLSIACIVIYYYN